MRSIQTTFLTVLLLAGLGGYTLPAQADAAPNLGYMLGLKSTDFDIAGGSTSSTPGLMVGVISVLEMGGGMFRTGAYYSQRKAEYTSDLVSGRSYDFSISYIDIPVTVLLSFNDAFSVYAGGVAAIKVSNKCEASDGGSCPFDESKFFHAAATVGLRSVFGPNWAAELAYELGLNDVSEDASMNAMNVNVQFLY